MEELILCNFEKENKSELDDGVWEDPYDSIWLRLATALISVAEFFASVIMIAFIRYETQAHGNYRTVINQLLSNFYLGVRKQDIGCFNAALANEVYEIV